MPATARELGRNEPCHCGSGKKYKQCCASKTTRLSRGEWMALVLVSIVLVGGLVLAIAGRQDHVGQATGVWSEEHGHYH